MAIAVSGANPTQVTVVSNTVTTNTTFNANAPNDRRYALADNIVGTVNAGVGVGGFGLELRTTLADGGVAMTNNGVIDVAQPVISLDIQGNGGAVTYAGTGFIANHTDVIALLI